MKTFNLSIYTTENVFYEGPCEHISIPAESGYIGILAGHSNLISSVIPGVINFRIPGEDNKEAITTKGMFKIENGNVTVLVHRCEFPEDVDINKLKREEAELKRIERERNSKREYLEAEANLSRTFNKLANKNKTKEF